MTKQKGCVYFFKHIGLTPIKIGYSKLESPLDRFDQFKTYAPFGSEIIGFIMTVESKELESYLHKKYSHKRLNGEWFEITVEEALKEIDFHSHIEDINDRNEFQIEWSKELRRRKELAGIEQVEIQPLSKKEMFFNMYAKDNNLNRSLTADVIGISRGNIYHWIREYNKRYK